MLVEAFCLLRFGLKTIFCYEICGLWKNGRPPYCHFAPSHWSLSLFEDLEEVRAEPKSRPGSAPSHWSLSLFEDPEEAEAVEEPEEADAVSKERTGAGEQAA